MNQLIKAKITSSADQHWRNCALATITGFLFLWVNPIKEEENIQPHINDARVLTTKKWQA